jgi:general secretion pathway protein D
MWRRGNALKTRGHSRAVALSFLLSCAACSHESLEQRADQPQSAADIVRSVDLSPRFATPTANTVLGGGGTQSRGFTSLGSGAASRSAEAYADPPPTAQAAAEVDAKDGYTLNFENSPVSNVAKSVLGDILGVGYVIDPRAQGTITLSTGRPIAKRDVLFVLENGLRANNLAMIHDTGGYRILPANEAMTGGVDPAEASGVAEPGYGLSVIPVKYVSGATLSRLMEGFAARPGAIRTDPSGRLLLVVGNGSERQSAIDTVRSFDVDWMQGQSVGLYPVANSAPDPIVAELEKIMDSGEAGLGHGLVKFQAVTRQNAVLVVAAKPELLQRAQRWIARLDAPAADSSGVKVYKLRYGDAKQVAKLLNDIFSSGGAATSDSAANQIAPGAGSSALTPTERLTGGRPNNGGTNGSMGSGAGAQGGGGAGANSPFGGLPTTSTAALSNAFANGGQGGSTWPNVRITADQANNSILVYGSTEECKIVERALVQLDRPKAQVAIDVTIAEVKLNDDLNYGVQFFLTNKLGSLIHSNGQLSSAAANISADSFGTPALSTSTLQGFNAVLGNIATPQVIINALHSLTDVKILSNPSLVVVDNEQASLEVGDQVPISTGSATVLTTNNTVVSTTDYKNTGIILNVQPRVNSNGSVLLDVEQEISSVPPGNTSLTPTISERKVKSEILVNNGQTVLLAGLVSDSQENARAGIPILDQTPIIGSIFSNSTSKSVDRTELIIFIRPQIIRDGADASRVAEELRAKMHTGRISAVSLPASLNIGAKGFQ